MLTMPETWPSGGPSWLTVGPYGAAGSPNGRWRSSPFAGSSHIAANPSKAKRGLGVSQLPARVGRRSSTLTLESPVQGSYYSIGRATARPMALGQWLSREEGSSLCPETVCCPSQ
jgi:hypothetical protein